MNLIINEVFIIIAMENERLFSPVSYDDRKVTKKNLFMLKLPGQQIVTGSEVYGKTDVDLPSGEIVRHRILKIVDIGDPIIGAYV